MNNNKPNINAVHVLLLAISIITNQVTAQETVLINSTNIEKEKDQVMIKASFETLDSLKLADIDVYSPTNLAINSAGDIALMGWNKMNIIFIKQGKLNEIYHIDSSKGRGPGEYESPFDIYLTNQGKVWVSDISHKKIEKWDPYSGELLMSHSFKNLFIKPDQIIECKADDNNAYLYLLSTQYGYGINNKEGILYSYMVKDHKLYPIATFQSLSNKDEYLPYAITGDLACGENPLTFYYSGNFSATIRKYKDGNLDYYRNSMGADLAEPLFFRTSETTTRMNPMAPKFNNGVFYSDGHVVIPTFNRKRNYGRFLDHYDHKTGEYKFTIKLPNDAQEVVLNDDILVAIEGVETEDYVLKVYRFEIFD